MTTTRTINGATYNIVSNGHVRELLSVAEMPGNVLKAEFAHVSYNSAFDESYAPRFFKYRNMWFDSHEFEYGSDDIKAMGYDAHQTQSYWNAICIGYFDKEGYEYDGAIRVAHIYW